MENNNIINSQQNFVYPKLDYSIEDQQQRNRIVHQIIETIPKEKLTPYYLEQLTRYLLITSEVKKSKMILTDNRMVTVNKREVSFEGIISKLENGQDGIYNYMTGGDRNILLTLKPQIKVEDLKDIPGLEELIEQIKDLEIRQKLARGKKKYLLIKQLIEARQMQYILKESFKPVINSYGHSPKSRSIDFYEQIIIDKKGNPVSNGLVSFFEPVHISKLLINYSNLKEESWGKFNSDLYYLMEDLDNLIEKTLKEDYPLYYDLLILKIDKMSNKNIAWEIEKKYGFTYSVEYLSALWRQKIPKLLAEQAKKDYLIWYYTYKVQGKWKRCSRCGTLKPAHSYFFTKNRTSKDGFYSLCKDCRNKKKKIRAIFDNFIK